MTQRTTETSDASRTNAPNAGPGLPGRRYVNQVEQFVADRSADVLALLLKATGKRGYRHMVRALKERQPANIDYEIKLFSPEYVSPDPAERPLVARILSAYKLAKRAQADHGPRFIPHGGWRKVVESAYAYLIDGFERDDTDHFHFFLANFGTWKKNTGITQSQLIRDLSTSKRKRINFEQREMARMVSWWQTFESQGRDLSVLTMPRHGNQCGVLVDGQLISPYSVFTEVHARLISGFVPQPEPVIGELGGGFGRLAYFLAHQQPESTYLGFDLPECLCCACYFLMNCFPEKRFLLYGEGDLTAESIAEFDYILLPSFEITKLPDISVDVFVNENSLGMLTPDACDFFVNEICRGTKAFWHRNHELRRNRFEDGTVSRVNSEYPVPQDQFYAPVRYGDVTRFVGQEISEFGNEMYWYFYRRKEAEKGSGVFS